MTEYDVKELSESIEKISTSELFNDGFDFNFKIILLNTSHVVEITNSTKPRTSNNYTIKGQSVLKSLQIQLQECPDHSVINIITNATAPDDVDLIPNILELVQTKRTEVNFLIPLEDELPATSLLEYKLITIISNGFIVCSVLPKFGFDLRPSMRAIEFPGSLNTWLKSVSQKITLLVLHSENDRQCCFHLDPFLKPDNKELILTRGSHLVNVFSYSDATMRVPGRDLQVDVEQPTKFLECVSIYVFTETPSLQYSLRISARSDFDIDYGFSTHAVRSLNETRKRPIVSESEKVYVTSSNKTFQPTFNSFSVLLLNGTYFGGDIPLHSISGTDLFTGSFKPPKKEYFFLQVTAYIKEEGISRLSWTAMNAADEYNKSENNSTNAQIYGNTTSSFISKIKKVT
ncbi:uncharacterized protein LOC135837619 isoform X2 [Planococcus citri]